MIFLSFKEPAQYISFSVIIIHVHVCTRCFHIYYTFYIFILFYAHTLNIRRACTSLKLACGNKRRKK